MIELLVVVSIVFILASILLPAIAKCRLHAKTTQCGGNLKQIGLAYFIYADDFAGWGPKVYDNITWVRHWPNTLLGSGYARNNKIFYCPASKTLKWRSYDDTYGFLLSWCGLSSPNLRMLQTRHSPAQSGIIFDSAYGADARRMAVYIYPVDSPFDPAQAAGYHFRKANSLFLDGHMGSCTPNESSKLEKPVTFFVFCGF